MDLKDKIEKSGLRAYDIHKMSDKRVSVGQASRWLKKGGPVSVLMLLERLCNEKMAQPPKPDKKTKSVAKEPTKPKLQKPVIEKQRKDSGEWPVATSVPSRGYPDDSLVEVGGFYYFEFGCTGWKLPKSQKAEKVLLGMNLVRWSDFKKI